MSLPASPHLRGILIAGGLVIVAAVLGFVTLGMNKTASSAAAQTIVPYKDRGKTASTAATSTPAAKAAPAATPKAKPKAKPKPKVDPNYTAAIAAGLPPSVAHALASHVVVVVQLTSAEDTVDKLTMSEAQAGARAAHAAFDAISVDRNGEASTLTQLLGTLPSVPATLVYRRPGTLVLTLSGFNDHETVEQAAITAEQTPATTTTPTSTPTVTGTPAS